MSDDPRCASNGCRPRPGRLVLSLVTAFTVSGDAGATTRFTEIAERAGISFTHDSGKVGRLWTLEITGAGCAIADFDGDGLMDIWLIQGGPLLERKGQLPGDRLFRNLGGLRFEDVTRDAGISATEYGMGIATADWDNDGDTDVFLANYGPNQLLENLGDGRFRDVTARSGIEGDAWSISASFADIDGDGLLDLYVGNYLVFDLDGYEPCERWSSRPSYCAPSNFRPESDRLYRNLGGGRFEDISDRAGIAGPFGGAMGVVAEDFDGDGRIDFYVANDGLDNKLWRNVGDGRFRDEGLLAGVAVNSDGIAEASMGIAMADFDRDSDVDLLVTHDVKESNTLYVNQGDGWFDDESTKAGLAAPSLPFSAFGVGWVDVENDGDLDLFVVNGAVAMIESQLAAGIEPPLRQRNFVMLNDGSGGFTATEGGPGLVDHEVSRGAAFGDLDNDGDLDVVVTNNHGKARLYRNDTPSMNWLGLALEGNPLSTGAVVWRENASPERKRVATDGSYAAAHDPRLLFGLGNDAKPQFVRVRWPSGREERFGPLATGRYHVLEEGRGSRRER